MEYRINEAEQDALEGLPYMQQIVYLHGIRRYMDYAIGIVGIKRGISYQSLREACYVEPCRGHKSFTPSRDQMRRALETLQRVGLIERRINGERLILKCLLATWDNCIQKLLASQSPPQLVTKPTHLNSKKLMSYEFQNEKAAIGWRPLPATPPEGGINIKNKYTHSDKNKNLIDTNFKPSDAIIQKAEKLGCKHASD